MAADAARGPDLRTRRVLQIGNGWFPERRGGIENVVWNLCRHLPEQGFDLRALVPGEAAITAASAGRVIAFAGNDESTLRRLRGVRRAARQAIAAHRPDLVAAHFALYAAPVLDLLGDIPLVVHFHGPWALESEVEGAGAAAVAAKRLLERLVYRRARRVIVASEAFGRLARERYGVPEDALRLVPCGVEADRFAIAETRAEARAALGWEEGRPIVFTVRRLVRRMGLGNLVEAVALLRGTQPRLLVCIAGNGPLREELEQQARALGVAGSVRFLGSLSDEALPLAYRAADLSIVPTLALEGFGLVAIESLAAGTPVLVTPSGGLPEVVRPLSPALVLEGMRPQQIAAGLAAALGEPGRLPGAEACRRHVRARFDWPRIAAATAAVYREVS